MNPELAEYIRLGKETALKPSKPLQYQDWLQQLANLDATSETALSTFLANTYIGKTEPIPLGAHKGVSYFIETAKDAIPQRGSISLTPLDSMRGVSEYVKSYEFELLPYGGGPRPDFRYGFGLGHLAYRSDANSTILENAGFFVVLNVLDKSVWVVVDMRPFENADTDFRIDPLPPTWGLLPKDDEKQVGLMRISQAEWWKKSPPSLVSGDPFTTFPSYDWQLISKPAVLSEYVGRLKKT